MLKYLTDPIVHAVLALAVVIGASGYAIQWHKKEVEVAVMDATYQAKKTLEDKHGKDLVVVKNTYDGKMAKLTKDLNDEKEKRRVAVGLANARADAAVKWLYDLPEPDKRGSDNTGINNTATIGLRPVGSDPLVGGLYRSDAEFLIHYSRKTEEMKNALIESRNSYSKVRKSYDALQLTCTPQIKQ